MRRTKSKPARRHARNQPPSQQIPDRLPFIAHIRELRKRLFYVAITVIAFGGIAYAVNEPITQLLLGPAGDQQFIYTTPGGGFDFLFKLCLYTGIAASIPVIVYQLLRYLQPLIQKDAMRFIAWGSVASAFLAIAGILFGYLMGLPAAMHFLLQGFSSDQIKALISIQSYMSFVMLYLLGSALLFQVPLVLILINRIKPLQPGKLMKFQRWFILIAFIVGAIVNPSPNVQDQLMLSIPMILMYQLGIVLVWAINRRHRKPKKVLQLLQKDEEMRASRLAQFESAQTAWRQLLETAPGAPVAAAEQSQPSRATPPTTPLVRPTQHMQELRRPAAKQILIQTPQAE
jgi:sec-independent protein translocase protein TatC